VNGLPVLASAIEGITCAVIDGRNGFLVSPEAVAIWVDKIHTLLADRVNLQKFGEESKDYTINRYAWEKMVEGYLAVFKKYHCQNLYSRGMVPPDAPCPTAAGQERDGT
jgi:glycosyltransferase involved in cell wall biosynthesis